ncbi:envelope-like protein, partial [Trifolium pratense]
MSNSAKTSPIKDDAARSSPIEVLESLIVNVVPISTIPPTSSTKKEKRTSKNDKTSQVSANSSSPSALIKKTKRKTKKSKSESSRAFTMSELHVDPLQSSNVDALVANPVVDNVDASGKIFGNLGQDNPIFDKTLGVENSDVSGNLGKTDFNPSTNVDATIGASTKTNNDFDSESLKKTGPETHVESSVVTLDAATSVVPDVATSLAPNSGNNLVDYSKSDESGKSNFANEEPSSDKNVSEDPDVVIMNDTTTSDKSLPTIPETSVARRTRSRAGKSVGTVNTPVQTPKPTSIEEKQKVKKRKAPPTSDSDFEPEIDVAAFGSTSRKSIGRKKVPLSVPYAPLDNVSFHLENGSTRWKYVYHRRMALERNLKEDVLECQNVVEAIEYAGLMKTVCGLDKCYDRLVKEFLINVAKNCDDPESPEYRQVFVRGKCVKFSPSVINQCLQRNTEELADLEVTDNEICKTITGGKLKVWPSKAKLSATQLSPLYAILNKIAAHNWVPTTHSSDVARDLGKFIYVVAFPTLLCSVILEQHPDILRDSDVPSKSCLQGQMLQQVKLKIDRVIEALKAEEAVETAEGELDGQEFDGTSYSGPGFSSTCVYLWSVICTLDISVSATLYVRTNVLTSGESCCAYASMLVLRGS